MMRFGLRAWGVTCVAIVSLVIGWHHAAWGVYLDKDSTIKFGARSYVNARVGTEKTNRTVFYAPDPADSRKRIETLKSRTFPQSPAGHLRQNRFFLEAEWDHDVTKLMKQGVGPLALAGDLPFNVRGLKYHLTYRGEGEGLWDWGPREYRTTDAYKELVTNANNETNPPNSCTLQTCPDFGAARRDVRNRGTQRHRLFQAYADIDLGDLFIRAGRQILVWGETDSFRLIDNINPIDSSFGGFLTSLDERRVPLDMIRLSYRLGEYGETVSEAMLEGFAAFDNRVSFYPGGLWGSPWALPNDNIPDGTTKGHILRPPRTLDSTRGGARLVFNAYDVTWSLAHYYTYSDLPSVQSCVAGDFPLERLTTADQNNVRYTGVSQGCPIGPTNLPASQRPICLSAGPDGQYGTTDDNPPNCRPPGTWDILAPQAYTIQHPSKTQVSGATATFTVPASISRRFGLSGEPVIRTELAYIKDDSRQQQSQLDPFIYRLSSPNPVTTGGQRHGDSINFVLGIDTNQFFRFLNANNSFFITTQLFYRHLKDHAEDQVLPVRSKNIVFWPQYQLGAVEPVLVRHEQDQFLQTLFIATSYMSGQVTPNFTFFYDWSGAMAYIPSVTIIRDPFRFTMQYNLLDAGQLKGNSGVSLLRDRDNALFQIEYVI